MQRRESLSVWQGVKECYLETVPVAVQLMIVGLVGGREAVWFQQTARQFFRLRTLDLSRLHPCQRSSSIAPEWRVTGWSDFMFSSRAPPCLDLLASLELHDQDFDRRAVPPVESRVVWRWGQRVDSLRLVDFRASDPCGLIAAVEDAGIELKSLCLKRLRTAQGVGGKLPLLPWIERLEVLGGSDDTLGPTFWTQLTRFHNLRVLHLELSYESDNVNFFRAAGDLPQLEDLTLVTMSAFQPSWALLLCHLLPPNLVFLKVGGLGLISKDAISMDNLGKLPRLRVLHVTVPSNGMTENDVTFNWSCVPLNLRELTIRGARLACGKTAAPSLVTAVPSLVDQDKNTSMFTTSMLFPAPTVSGSWDEALVEMKAQMLALDDTMKESSSSSHHCEDRLAESPTGDGASATHCTLLGAPDCCSTPSGGRSEFLLRPRQDDAVTSFERWVGAMTKLTALTLDVSFVDRTTKRPDVTKCLCLEPMRRLRFLEIGPQMTLAADSGPFQSLEKLDAWVVATRPCFEAPNLQWQRLNWHAQGPQLFEDNRGLDRSSQWGSSEEEEQWELISPLLERLQLNSSRTDPRVGYPPVTLLCRNLRQLSLDNVDMFAVVGDLPNLQQLSLRAVRRLRNLDSLVRFSGLRHLTIADCPDLRSILGFRELLRASLESFDLEADVSQLTPFWKDHTFWDSPCFANLRLVLRGASENDDSLVGWLTALYQSCWKLTSVELHSNFVVPRAYRCGNAPAAGISLYTVLSTPRMPSVDLASFEVVD